MSIYIKDNIIKYKDNKYERLYNHLVQVDENKYEYRDYRVIFSDDNYDYVEDKELIKQLNKIL